MNSDAENADKGNILVVDDSPDNLRVLSAKLTVIGYKVRCVTNGEMALLSISSYRPDLILLDIRMPILDGYEVCQRIKSNPKTKDIPVIFLSAIDDVVDKVKAFEIGGADYITKPFQAEEILARIANQLTIKRLQNQLTAQNQQLQREIDAHRQTEAALQDAKEIAEIANHAKSNFIARMSHELRTPLNAILGFSGLMSHDSALAGEHQDYASSINQSAQRLLESINRILAVTREESNHITLNEQAFNLHSLLESMASYWRLQAQKKGLKFNFICDSRVPAQARADDGKLRQVLIQLLKNAVQFTVTGQISLQVNVADSQGEDGHRKDGQGGGKPSLEPYPNGSHPDIIVLSFEIEDTGFGIAAHEINQIFQAFSQAEAGQKSEQGLGLGLYASHQYIQSMKGHITLSSIPGQGTRARFYIPVERVYSDLDLGMQPGPVEVDTFDETALFSLTSTVEAAEVLMDEALEEGLPIEWITQLNRAAIQGFDHQIKQLIQEIPVVHLPLVDVILEWNRNFQFDQIMVATQHVLERSL